MSQEIVLSSFDKEELLQFQIADIGLVYDPKAISFDRYEEWLKHGYASYLTYLKDERADKRVSLLEVFPDFKSALVFLFPYKKSSAGYNQLKIADYVMAFQDQDYHKVLPQKIKSYLDLQTWSKTLDYKIIVDTAPVLERDLAYRAGLGWFGKNSMLINKYIGSYFLIASVLFDVKITIPSKAENIIQDFEADHCGSCRACIEACPTNAIIENSRQIEVEKCIASYTIELFTKEKKFPTGSEQRKEIFGCDICQSVCPWNSKIPIASMHENENSVVAKTFLNDSMANIIKGLEAMSKRSFKKLFSNSPIGRTGRDALLKNILDKLN